MGGGEKIPADAIMTKETNAPVLAICYAQGWCENENYMTATEAAAVTDIGTVFKSNTSITHFEEFQYFIGITSIPNQAFYGCNKLQTVVLPPNITTIGSEAFRSASVLAGNDFIIPEGVTAIGAQAFRGTRIAKVTIPTTVTSLGGYTFINTYTTTVVWNAGISPNVNETDFSYAKTYLSDVYTSTDGVLYKDGGSTLFAVPRKKSNFIIPDTVTNVASKACYYYDNTVTLGNNIKTIGSYAFRSAKVGTYLVIPDSCESIGQNAFRMSNYRLLYIPPSCTVVGSSTFADTPNNVTNRIGVINQSTPPTGGSQYTFTCHSPKWKMYVPIGCTGNYPIRGILSSSYVQSVSEMPSTFDTSSKQAIIDSLDALDASA